MDCRGATTSRACRNLDEQVGALLGQIKEGAGAPVKAGTATGSSMGRPDIKTATTTPINAADEEPAPRATPKPEANYSAVRMPQQT